MSATAVPSRHAAPKLLARGGYTVIDTLPGGTSLYRMILREALDAAPQAERQEYDRDEADERGGTPARRLFSSGGGDAQQALYSCRRFHGLLAGLVGANLEPTGAKGSYSYYVRPGDFLGLHRDILQCDVAAITCLCDCGGDGDSGALRLYPGRAAEPLTVIRSTPDQGVASVQLHPGQTIILLGGYVAHATVPMSAAQKRVISVLCYRGDWAE
jgi:hypothetical protein